MKYDISHRTLSKEAKKSVADIIGWHGDATALIRDIEAILARKKPRADWDKKTKQSREIKRQAKGLLNTLECMRPELKREANSMLVSAFLGMTFNQLFDRDFIGMLIVSLRARIEGQASARVCKGAGEIDTVRASYERTKEDIPSLNMVDALAEAWRKNTQYAVSYADCGRFMEFLIVIMNDTGAAEVHDPRRIIKRVLETNPALRNKPKK